MTGTMRTEMYNNETMYILHTTIGGGERLALSGAPKWWLRFGCIKMDSRSDFTICCSTLHFGCSLRGLNWVKSVCLW
jgi:hypothetical protein